MATWYDQAIAWLKYLADQEDKEETNEKENSKTIQHQGMAKEQCDLFLAENEQLIKDYLMIE